MSAARRRPPLDDDAASDVVNRVHQSRKYSSIHHDTIRDIVEQERAEAHSALELERRARARLHRAVAAYLRSASPSAMRAALDDARLDSDAELRAWCMASMRRHASTAERIDDIDRVYATVGKLVGPTPAIADLACAFNVLSLPWFTAHLSVRYVGYDFDAEIVELGLSVARKMTADAVMVHADVLVRPDVVQEDVALLLKMFHCLEARRRGAGTRLIDALPSTRIVVSLPTRSRSGRVLGFDATHGRKLADHCEARGWTITRRSLASEALWLITKSAPSEPTTDANASHVVNDDREGRSQVVQ